MLPSNSNGCLFVLLQVHEPEVTSPLGTDVAALPPGVVGVLPLYRTLVELHREHGIDAKYAELVIGGGGGK